MNTIQSWNDDLQDTESVEITESTKIVLGCDDQPIVEVSEWMAQQGIDTLEEMADYINSLDFNVQVVA